MTGGARQPGLLTGGAQEPGPALVPGPPDREGSPAADGAAAVVHTHPAETPEEVAAGPAGEQPARPAVPEGVRVAAAAL